MKSHSLSEGMAFFISPSGMDVSQKVFAYHLYLPYFCRKEQIGHTFFINTHTTMKKIYSITLFLLFLSVSNTSYGQSLKDILNSSAVKEVVSAVVGEKALTASDLQASWSYIKPACDLESANLLKDAGGNVISSQIEKKLDELCKKAGITEGKFGYTFHADSTFTNTLPKGNPITGTYSFNAEKQTVTLKYGKLLKLTSFEAKVVQSGENLNLLFNANKLMTLLNLLSSVSQSETIKAVNKLFDQYDGIMLGFELKKQVEQ